MLPLALVLAVGTAGANGAERGEGGVVPGAVALALLAALSLLLRRWPAAAIGGNGVLVGAYFALGYADGPIYLTVPLATLAVAHRTLPRDWWPWSTVAVGLVAIGQGVRAADGASGWRETFWQVLATAAITAAAGALGTALRARREAREDRTQRAATEERLRMAQDLHDGVGHGLAVIAMQAGVALHVLDKEPEKARASLEAIRDLSRESLDALRAELARMSGEPAARRPAPGVADLDSLVDRVRTGGLAVDLRVDVGELPGPVSRTAYAVVQESLTNVLRHARASRASVVLAQDDDRLTLTVTDDGREPASASAGQDGGMGISGMRSRVEALGGTLDAGPGPGGFRVRAVLPVQAP